VIRAAAAALLLVACSHEEPIASCNDRLGGVWTTPAGRWMVLDNGPTLEAFPMFDDAVPDGAPRVIDFERADKPGGQIKRRFMQRERTCEARAPIHVTKCTGDTLQVARGDVTPPLSFAPCAWGQQVPTRVETWRRE